MAKKAQATWGGRFSKGPAELMLAFGESVSFDKRLAPYDIEVNKAHTAMLQSIGLLTKKELRDIHKGLEVLAKRIAKGEVEWKAEFEDVHMNIEQLLTKITPAAAKMHTARSRNDQVATDVRLFFKDACGQMVAKLERLLGALLTIAEKNQDVFIPGYTHLQRAQPVSVAHHLLAYVEMFGRDIGRFVRVYENANWCPLGSGAIAGTTLPIDREFTAKALGFVDARGKPQVTPNSMDAVADRDLFLDFAHACSVTATHISRVAEDVIIWNSSEFSYVSLPDAFCTGSSLMPQKKNPDSLELLRGKSGRIIGNEQSLFVMVKGLPLTYNRDLQEDKPQVFDSFDQLSISLDVLTGTVEGMEFREAKCAAAVSDPALLATDLADYLVNKGVAFREAHHVVGALVALGEKLDCPLNEIPNDQAKALHPKMGDDWMEVFDLQRAMKAREGAGMPGPKQIRKQLAKWKKSLG
ncbi:argininosuccinate lyase [Pelagicoccus sp. SDUM812003]|uniref:argininosuccinate lyase n=1 Tax=Pelagicoccus sp. SDUM812003 TaxID=3041267 RepID=UPI00280C70AD|nr:argininosuccinate lyase [Pelagicoccus sp. SDUM812003]MDQ8203237.1 argininosuccinate lyase [Pelagicoccus sp. SDUM812003]